MSNENQIFDSYMFDICMSKDNKTLLRGFIYEVYGRKRPEFEKQNFFV